MKQTRSASFSRTMQLLSLSQNPVMHLTDDEFNRCKEDFDVVEQRMEETDHRFYDEMMYSVMRTLILDFFDFHARINDMEESPTDYRG